MARKARMVENTMKFYVLDGFIVKEVKDNFYLSEDFGETWTTMSELERRLVPICINASIWGILCETLDDAKYEAIQ